MKKREKEKNKPRYNPWQNSVYMIRFSLRRLPSVFVLCVLSGVIQILQNLVQLLIAPGILQRLEDGSALSAVLWTILGFTLAALLLRAAETYVAQNTMFGRVDLRTELVTQIHEKFATTSFPNTEDEQVLKQVERAQSVVSDNSAASEAIWNTFTALLRAVGGFAIYLTMLTSLHPALFALILCSATAEHFINRYLNGWGWRHREEESEYSKKLCYVSDQSENRLFAKDVRIFGMRQWLEDVYTYTIRAYQAFLARGERVYFLGNAVNVLLAFIRNGAAYGVLLSMVLEQELTASAFLLYFSAVGAFSGQISGIFSALSTLRWQSQDLSLVREFLELPEPFRFAEGKPLAPEPGKAYELRLSHVSFRYPGAEKDTLHDLNLTIAPGEKLAVVGVNGAGKTTLVKLLCGFYDPTEGSVLLNGEDIRQFDRQAYYRMFSAVFQDFSVLAATLAENVAQTDKDMDRERVVSCLKKAGLEEKLAKLPDGPDTHLGSEVFEDGIRLSGGETQRLLLARALYKEAPILVLDEPTAALDPIAENDLYQKYSELTAGKTAVYISHRLASTRFCDRILLLSDSEIAEEGTHEELMAAGGFYAKMFAVQSKYYQEGGASDEEAAE